MNIYQKCGGNLSGVQLLSDPITTPGHGSDDDYTTLNTDQFLN